jgi:hypothetical protein
MAMLDVGIPVTAGSGVAAASNYWRSHRSIGKHDVGEEHRLGGMSSKALARVPVANAAEGGGARLTA